MIRTLITPRQQDISINLPKSFIGKKVEVIAFTLDATPQESILIHLASQDALSKDWLTPEEDKAWENL